MQSWSRCSFTTYKIERLSLHAVMYLHAHTDLQLLRVTEIPLDSWFPESYLTNQFRGTILYSTEDYSSAFFSLWGKGTEIEEKTCQ